MRIRREVRCVLWGLWLACLVFSIWFFAEVITLFLQVSTTGETRATYGG
ncbi:hypothetical protein AB0K74_34010 [Streptomyces sp. NPDC056159]